METSVYRYGAWMGVGVIALAIGFETLRGEGLAAAVLAMFFLLSVLVLSWRRPGPNLFDVLFVAAALLNAVGYAGRLYDSLFFFDELAHTVTAFTITAALGTLIYGPVLPQLLARRGLFLLALTSFGLSIGALWEIFEFVVDVRVGLADTVSDLAFDTLGAVGGAMAVGLSARR